MSASTQTEVGGESYRPGLVGTLQRLAPSWAYPWLKTSYRLTTGVLLGILTLLQRLVQTPTLLLTRLFKRDRKLEIGPGGQRIPGFETLNIRGGLNVDFVWNAQRRLPFRTGTFQVIYASHILEHIPWYRTEQVLREWMRILAPGGRLEIWVPDGLRIAKAFVEAEQSGSAHYENDGWYRFNPDRDPCLWASGRMFSYGDGTGKAGHPNWHLALFSPRYLEQLLRNAGCTHVERLQRSQVRGYDHGWINLGFVGIKPTAGEGR